jgi:outer membrane protein assembly factor BamB
MTKEFTMRRLTAILALITGAGVAHAQFGRGAGDWNTVGGDAQRSNWVRNDAKIAKSALEKPGFGSIWKVKVDNSPKQGNALTPALVMTGYIGYRGFRSLAFLGGSSDKVFAFDTDLGKIEWQKSVPGAAVGGGTATCPGGMTANVARATTTAFPAMPQGGGRFGGGRGSAAKSGVGEPGEGGVTLKELAARAPAPAFPAGRAGRAPGGPPRRMPNYLHVLASDGMMHSMYVSNGEEPEPAMKFLAPNANAQGLIVVDNVAYVTTSGGCGGVADGVWALDLDSKQVTNWAGKIAGATGPTLGPDGTVYVSTTTGDVVALEPKTLKMKEAYQSKQELTTSPVLFQYKDKTLAAAATRDGKLHVLDTSKMTAPLATAAAPNANGAALSSWQDSDGTRWLLVPTASGIGAWKLVEQNGATTLEQGWKSRDITSPITPMIVNGVVFAASSGQRGTPAVLYALDGGTGKELWNSGKAITSFVPRGGGLSGGGTQLYLGTYDGTFYAFGFPIEH